MGLNLVPVDIPAGIQADDTAYAAAPAWDDGNNVRFRLGRPQTIGGWESLTLSLLNGVCRTVFNWTENLSNSLDIAFGNHNGLQVWQGGVLATITPTLALPSVTLGTNPFTVANASPTVTVNQPAHGYLVGESVVVTSTTGVGRQVVSGTFPVATVVDADHWTFTNGSNFTLARTLSGSTPLSVTNASVNVVVTDTAHNLSPGTSVTISGAAAVGGITPNGTFPITIVDANTYSYQFTSAATSTATGGGASVVATAATTGGGTTATVANQRAWTGGAIDGAGSGGYGTGSYGGGAYGAPSAADYFAMTWSLSAWGQKLLANPRGKGLYLWSNNALTPAAPIPNSPAQVTYALTSPQRQVFALGCNQEVGNAFNPLAIRHSDIGNETGWSSIATSASTAREYVLPGGGRIVAGRFVGRYLLVWTNHSLFLGTYVGQIGQVWSFSEVAKKCGLIGPNAAVVVGSTAYWMSADRTFHSYTLGGAVTPFACPVHKDFADNLAPSQWDKIVASSIAEFSEIRFDYPDNRDGFENSRYIAMVIAGPDMGSWYRGQMSRTAMVDAGPSTYPIGVTYQGNAYWHEKGASADGGGISWFISTADMFFDVNKTILTRKFFPDLGPDQKGAVNLTITSYMSPNDRNPRTFGPYVIPPGQQEVDIFAEGRLFQLTFSGSTAPAYMRMGRLLFDIKPRGKR